MQLEVETSFVQGGTGKWWGGKDENNDAGQRKSFARCKDEGDFDGESWDVYFYSNLGSTQIENHLQQALLKKETRFY